MCRLSTLCTQRRMAAVTFVSHRMVISGRELLGRLQPTINAGEMALRYLKAFNFEMSVLRRPRLPRQQSFVTCLPSRGLGESCHCILPKAYGGSTICWAGGFDPTHGDRRLNDGEVGLASFLHAERWLRPLIDRHPFPLLILSSWTPLYFILLSACRQYPLRTRMSLRSRGLVS